MPTEFHPQERRKEEKEVTWGPMATAVALGVAAVVGSFRPWLALVPLAAAAGAVAWWVREAIAHDPIMHGPAAEHEKSGDRFHKRSLYWWGSLVFAVFGTFLWLVSVRVAEAHEVLSAATGVRGDLDVGWGIALLALAIAAAVVAIVADHRAKRDPGRGTGALLWTVVLLEALAVAAAMAQAVLLWRTGDAATSPQRAALTWALLLPAAWMAGSAVAAGVTAHRCRLGQVPRSEWGVVAGVMLQPRFLAVVWLLTFLLFFQSFVLVGDHLA